MVKKEHVVAITTHRGIPKLAAEGEKGKSAKHDSEDEGGEEKSSQQDLSVR